MTHVDPIAVFAYAFAHRKTHDFLLELAAAGFKQVVVLAAPWVDLPRLTAGPVFQSSVSHPPPLDTQTLCSALGYVFYKCEHDHAATIKSIQSKYGFQLGIIAGARIIKPAVIEIFEQGIINLHPGKLPETAGLDAFFYTILKNIPMGVTAHFIDSRVDAGFGLFFEETYVGSDHTMDVVLHNNYCSQILALRRIMRLLITGTLKGAPINRPCKNKPMSFEERRLAMAEFSKWREGRSREYDGGRSD